jgi:pilus assembly protein CpaE
VATTSILLVDSDPKAGDEVRTLLSAVGHTVTVVTEADEGFRAASDHGLVVIDIVTGARSAIDLCREIRATPSLASVPVLCIAQTADVEARIAFLEVGADDVVARPFDPREVEARIEALLTRFQRSRELAPVSQVIGATAPMDRRIVAVFSPKGGVGTTTIATNLAVMAAGDHPDGVLLVDLALPFGQAATHLDLRPSQTLADLVTDPPAMTESELLRGFAARHQSGVRLLPAPTDPGLADTITPAHVERLLVTSATAFDRVIVDAGSHLDERAMTVLDRSDAVVIPITAEIPALKALHALIEHLTEVGSVTGKTTFVLNGLFAREILRVRDVESALGAKVGAEIPYEPFLYLKAVNEGIPVVLGAAHSAPAEAFRKLGTQVFGEQPAGEGRNGTGKEEQRRSRGLAGLLRR